MFEIVWVLYLKKIIFYDNKSVILFYQFNLATSQARYQWINKKLMWYFAKILPRILYILTFYFLYLGINIHNEILQYYYFGIFSSGSILCCKKNPIILIQFIFMYYLLYLSCKLYILHSENIYMFKSNMMLL